MEILNRIQKRQFKWYERLIIIEDSRWWKKSCFSCFDSRKTGSFSVTDPFLTTFYYVEKQNGILRKNMGDGF